MTRKKTNKNKNYTPYYIWGLHASIAALNNNNRKEEYQLMESERVIFKHGKFIGPNIIPGIMNVVYDNSSNSLIVECSRGIYMFDLLSSA